MKRVSGVIWRAALMGVLLVAGLLLAHLTGVLRPGDSLASDPGAESTAPISAPGSDADAQTDQTQTGQVQTDQAQTGQTQTGQVQAGKAQAGASSAPRPNGETTQPAPQPESAPSLDTFRLDPDGRALVAGRGLPGTGIEILVDGVPVASAEADGSGQFVTFLDLPPSDQPRILSLSAQPERGGAAVMSAQEVVIAPAAARLAQPEGDEDGQAQPGSALSGDATQPAETRADMTASTGPDSPAQGAAAQQPRALLLDGEGVRLLDPPALDDTGPGPLGAVALDVITYSQDGEVRIQGRARATGEVRVYLDNAPISSARVSREGNWRSDLPEIDSGVYTLRIDQVDAQGKVTSRVETPFKREARALLSGHGAGDDTDPGTARVTAVTVQPGSTLWAISREIYGDGVFYVRVFEANRDRIRDPDLIYPGQVFALPE